VLSGFISKQKEGLTMATFGNLGKSVLVLIGMVSLALLGGCGDTDGGSAGDETFNGTSFVDTDEDAGSIKLGVNDDTLDVAESTAFMVSVRDSLGAPVPNMEIACDTETGLALIEPNTGYELTDGNGNMSGTVGCTLPGSYRLGCRLPMGAYKRALVTLHCNGPIPSGFTGFPGAGGGTLGTGGGQPSGGSSVGGEVRLTSITAAENGQDTVTIDVYLGSCGMVDQNGDGDKVDACDLAPEPFTDTLVKFSVTNTTSQRIFLRSFKYSISDSDGFGTPFESSQLAFSSGGEVGPSMSAELTGLFLRGGGSGNSSCAGYPSGRIGLRKYFTGKSTPIPTDLGFKNVTFTLRGVDGSGRPIEVSGRAGLSFSNYDKCSS